MYENGEFYNNIEKGRQKEWRMSRLDSCEKWENWMSRKNVEGVQQNDTQMWIQILKYFVLVVLLMWIFSVRTPHDRGKEFLALLQYDVKDCCHNLLGC